MDGTQTLTGKIMEFPAADVIQFLLGQDAPVMEAALIKHLTGLDKIPATYEELFSVHFSLYHTLYILKTTKGEQGYYLHLDPMRIRMIKIPGSGACTFYFPEKGHFCGRKPQADNFCSYHIKEHQYHINKISYDPLFDFYINPENISFCRDGLIKKVMKGAISYSLKRGEIQRAADFFGLANPDKKLIKKRYHELAKLYHPDRMKGDDSMMKNLNVSYMILCEVYVL